MKTNATTVKAVDALVKAGITATFTTDNNVTNKIDIAVEDEAVSEEKVRYLAFEPITQRFDYTKSQVIKVSVQAIGEGDSALKGESISLTRTGLTTQQLQDLGLTLKVVQLSRQTKMGLRSLNSNILLPILKNRKIWYLIQRVFDY